MGAVRILVGVVVMGLVFPGVVSAADPRAGSGDPAGQRGGGGVVMDAATRTPAQLGYTAADVAAKAEIAARYRPPAGATASSVAPLGYAASGTLAGYIQYHQKQSHWCLAAVLQSILRYKFGPTWVTPSVLARQTEIDTAISSGYYEYDSLGLAWINGRLAGYGSPFRYVYKGRAQNWNQLSGWIQMDVDLFRFPTYVSVDVSNPNYIWRQNASTNHATAAIGYSSYGSSAQIGDPFTSPSTGPAYCRVGQLNPSYSSTPDLGCVYPAWDMNKYWLASTSSWI